MTLVWDPTLPQSPLVSGSNEALIPQSIQTSMSTTYPPKKRRRFSGAQSKNITYAFFMTQTQLTTLYNFYNNVTQGGSQPFNFIQPSTGVLKLHTFDDSVGNPITEGYASPTQFKVQIKMRVDP